MSKPNSLVLQTFAYITISYLHGQEASLECILRKLVDLISTKDINLLKI